MSRFAIVFAAIAALALQGCVSTVVGTAAGAAAGVTGAVIGTTAKAGVAVGKAVIPGGGDEDKKQQRDR